MIGCETAGRLMNERLDGDIGPADAIDLEVHLNGCSACREIASGLETVASGLLSMPLESMPDDDFDTVIARTVGRRDASDSVTARSSSRRSRLVLAAAAAVLAAAVVVPLVLRESAPPEPSTAEVERAARDARMVLAVAARAVRSAETAARDRVIAREISPALQHVPVRWSRVASSRRNGA